MCPETFIDFLIASSITNAAGNRQGTGAMTRRAAVLAETHQTPIPFCEWILDNCWIRLLFTESGSATLMVVETVYCTICDRSAHGWQA
jgi:hypothetical protein